MMLGAVLNPLTSVSLPAGTTSYEPFMKGKVYSCSLLCLSPSWLFRYGSFNIAKSSLLNAQELLRLLFFNGEASLRPVACTSSI